MDEVRPPTKQRSLATALAAAQRQLQDPLRNKSAQLRGRQAYHYAGLDDLLAVVRPVLAAHGVAFTQTLDLVGDQVVLKTRLWVEDGDEVVSLYPMVWKGTHHDKGSEITYARKYSLEAIVGVAATHDEDGATPVRQAELSSQRPAQPQRSSPAQAAPAAQPKPPPPSGISLEDWPRELAEADLDPEEVDWYCEVRSKLRKLPRDMTDAQRRKALEVLSATDKLERALYGLRTEFQRSFFPRWRWIHPSYTLEDGVPQEIIDREKAAMEARRDQLFASWYGVESLWDIPIGELVGGAHSLAWVKEVELADFDAEVTRTLGPPTSEPPTLREAS